MVFSEEGQPLCERCSSSIKIEHLLTPGWEHKGKVNNAAECASSCSLCSLVWGASGWGRFWFKVPLDYSLTIHASNDKVLSSRELKVDIFLGADAIVNESSIV
jgi:hypothetical protein